MRLTNGEVLLQTYYLDEGFSTLSSDPPVC